MKIKWLGHSCFLIQSDSGMRIITDPYNQVQGIKYAPIKEVADIVTISHDHFDHNAVSAVAGKPVVVKRSGNISVKGISFKCITSHHDEEGGKQRGSNIILCFTMDGVKICHLGDLGHPLNKSQLGEIGEVDILFIPIGGFFTIDARVASQICNELQPKITIPMHYKTAKLDFPVAGVNDFLMGKNNFRKLNSNELEIKFETLPSTPQIIVFALSS
jgi:L-ascorbate metabolism protein UlaG (beta-lactamase superfamily)